MDDNRILFVDLDGTLIKEDLTNLAFNEYLKTKPFRLLVILLIFYLEGNLILKKKYQWIIQFQSIN